MSTTGEYQALPVHEQMGLTATVAAMNATVEAERRDMENRLQKLEDTLSRGVARALKWLAGLAIAMMGGVISINIQITRTAERQQLGEIRHDKLLDAADRRIDDLDRRIDRLEHEARFGSNTP
jgi:hypothetical protein